jgi:hypothetical protein
MPHDVCMWSISLRNQAHSRDASYSVMIFEWSVDVAIKVCFVDFHEIEVPPCRNMNPVYDLAFYGSDK